MSQPEKIKWLVIENIATVVATAAVISAGFYFGLDLFSFAGFMLLYNLNTTDLLK